jgi:hypothetical protein
MPWNSTYRSELVKKMESAGIVIIDQAYHRHESLNEMDVTIDIGYTDSAKFEALEAELRDGQQVKLMVSERA